ncbi:MAG: hypothetical protein WA733_24445 [Methylocystis sp.]|jgi:hypothetical protein
MYKPPTADSDNKRISDDATIEITACEVAKYSYEMCAELAIMAKDAGMPMLWYLLNLASAEAFAKCRDPDAVSH